MTEPTPTSARPRARAWIIGSAAAVLLSVIAVVVTLAVVREQTDAPAARPQPQATAPAVASSSATPRLLSDPVAAEVCPKILALQKTRAIYDEPDGMQAIGEQAANSADFDVAVNGQMLAERAKLARAAKGGDDETSTTLQMGGAAVNLATACIKGGFKQ